MRNETKSLTIQMRIWRADDKGGPPKIKMAWPGANHISWVTDNEASKRCHRNLYGKLKETLESQGKW